MNRGIRSHSAIHKVRNCFDTLIKPRGILNTVYFAVPDRTVYSDTYFTMYSYYFTYLGTSYQVDAAVAPLSLLTPVASVIATQAITGRITMHDVGDGINDSLLNRIVIEAYPDNTWRTYTDTDPKLYINTRNSAWLDEEGTNTIELVALNLATKGGINPFCSVMQTPNVEDVSDRVTFTGDETFSGGVQPSSQGKPTESLVLNAPLNTKFRKMSVAFVSTKVAVVKSISVLMSTYARRGWG